MSGCYCSRPDRNCKECKDQQDCFDKLMELSYSHKEKCSICSEEIDDLAGNPFKWGIRLPYKEGKGHLKVYCTRCVVKAVEQYKGE